MKSWKTACLAALLLLGCDFGSESGSASRRLWRVPLRADTQPVWKSDSTALAVEGDSLLLHRFWNGCYRLFGRSKAIEFLGSTTFAAEVVEAAEGDSLRMTFFTDSLRRAAFGEIRGACQSDAPAGKILIKANDLDGGSFDLDDSLRVTVDYEYIPEAGDARTYSLGLTFYDAPDGNIKASREVDLTDTQGTVRMAFPTSALPSKWREGQSTLYKIHLSYARSPNEGAFIFSLPYRPVKANYRPALP